MTYEERVFQLSDRQQKAVNKMLNDSRARYIELPYDPSTSQEVKVLQGDGQYIGSILLWQAIKLTSMKGR